MVVPCVPGRQKQVDLLSYSLVWSTEQDPGQPELLRYLFAAVLPELYADICIRQTGTRMLCSAAEAECPSLSRASGPEPDSVGGVGSTLGPPLVGGHSLNGAYGRTHRECVRV